MLSRPTPAPATGAAEQVSSRRACRPNSGSMQNHLRRGRVNRINDVATADNEHLLAGLRCKRPPCQSRNVLAEVLQHVDFVRRCRDHRLNAKHFFSHRRACHERKRNSARRHSSKIEHSSTPYFAFWFRSPLRRHEGIKRRVSRVLHQGCPARGDQEFLSGLCRVPSPRSGQASVRRRGLCRIRRGTASLRRRRSARSTQAMKSTDTSSEVS